MDEERHTEVLCRGCLQKIDPDTCWCGASRKYHGNVMDEGHSFVPMGCNCLRISDEEEPKVADKVIDWPFPWKKPESVYESDGPIAKRGRQHDVVVCNVLFMVASTGDGGFSTGRRRYRVDCQDCNEILHENTTGPSFRIRDHLRDRHAIRVRW